MGDRIPLFQAGKSGTTKSARFSTDIGISSNPRVTANSPYLNTNSWYRIEVKQFFDKAQDQVEKALDIPLYQFVILSMNSGGLSSKQMEWYATKQL